MTQAVLSWDQPQAPDKTEAKVVCSYHSCTTRGFDWQWMGEAAFSSQGQICSEYSLWRSSPSISHSKNYNKDMPASVFHLWAVRQSEGWSPPSGPGEAAGSRRCWRSRSGCASGRSAAPRVGSASPERRRRHVTSSQIPSSVKRLKDRWHQPAAASPGSWGLPPGRTGARRGNSSLWSGTSESEHTEIPVSSLKNTFVH